MATIPLLLKIEEKHAVPALREAAEKLDGPEEQFVLDFSAVRRIHPAALQALEELARVADKKSKKLALQGVNVDIYKVLKLVKLTRRFSFVNERTV